MTPHSFLFTLDTSWLRGENHCPARKAPAFAKEGEMRIICYASASPMKYNRHDKRWTPDGEAHENFFFFCVPANYNAYEWAKKGGWYNMQGEKLSLQAQAWIGVAFIKYREDERRYRVKDWAGPIICPEIDSAEA